MPGGTVFGAASGMIYRQQSRFVRSKYVLPPCISIIESYEVRYLIMAILGAAERNVTAISTANPSTLLKILDVLNDNLDVVLDSIESGTLHASLAVDPEIAGEINARLRPDKKRRRELEDLRAEGRPLTYKDIWPNLAGIVTWTGGSCQVPLHSLKKLLPEQTKIIELGYVASEFRGTINIGNDQNHCLPTFIDNYFEFAERQLWESGSQIYVPLDQLEEGQEYYVFVTTPDGLYRYDINDILRVTGWVGKTPALEFVRKGKGVTNITGEKIHEDQVISAVLGMCDAHDLISGFFVMLADTENSAYHLFIELEKNEDFDISLLSKDIDQRLRDLNIEYDEKCKSGRLTPVCIYTLSDGTADNYRAKLVSEGQRDAQFKVQCLQYVSDCPFDFHACTES
ncbi:MAG: GH3 auxin-responsive promoter family protein [Sneathiella sp.]|nr:GH3 auxin-responsive promoter family protein [Sneathiella sp.]